MPDYSPPNAPEVVTLCGSTRFKEEFLQAQRDLTLRGKIVISVGLFGHLEGLDMEGQTKVALDELHKRKIDISDSIFVVNVGGYIGESTKGEIRYAWDHGKRIEYLEPVPRAKERALTPPRPRPDPVDALAQEIRRVDGAHTLGAAELAERLQPFLGDYYGHGQDGDFDV